MDAPPNRSDRAGVAAQAGLAGARAGAPAGESMVLAIRMFQGKDRPIACRPPVRRAVDGWGPGDVAACAIFG